MIKLNICCVLLLFFNIAQADEYYNQPRQFGGQYNDFQNDPQSNENLERHRFYQQQLLERQQFEQQERMEQQAQRQYNQAQQYANQYEQANSLERSQMILQQRDALLREQKR